MGVKIKNRKGKARTGQKGKLNRLSQKQRWSEVTVTYESQTPEQIITNNNGIAAARAALDIAS